MRGEITLVGTKARLDWDAIKGITKYGPAGIACRLVPSKAVADATAEAMAAAERAAAARAQLRAEQHTQGSARQAGRGVRTASDAAQADVELMDTDEEEEEPSRKARRAKQMLSAKAVVARTHAGPQLLRKYAALVAAGQPLGSAADREQQIEVEAGRFAEARAAAQAERERFNQGRLPAVREMLEQRELDEQAVELEVEEAGGSSDEESDGEEEAE